MSRRKERPDHLEIGMDVVRTPETIYDTDDGGKGQRRPMHGYVCYIHPRGFFTPSPLRCAAGSSKRVFKAWRYEHERNKSSQG